MNEEEDIADCLASIADQRNQEIEVVVVDADSNDGTVPRVQEAREELSCPVRLDLASERIPIGEARNRAVRMAGAPRVAFLSADVELHERWTQEALDSLEDADMVFSRQIHAPREWTTAAAVRGLRYHFPDEEVDDPLTYASNAAAAYDRQVLEDFPFEPDVVAVDDLLLARRATRAGYKAAYNPELVVYHHDVASVDGELSKNAFEARGWGLNTAELGLMIPALAWGVALVFTLALLLTPSSLLPTPTMLDVGLLAGVLWAPALRRGIDRAGQMPPVPLATGVIASPVFDLVFLASYVRGLVDRDGSRPTADAEGIEP